MGQPIQTPTFVAAGTAAGRQLLDQMRATATTVVDATPACVSDLFKIDFPYIAPGSPEFEATQARYADCYPAKPKDEYGIWVFIPWRSTLVHLPDERDFFRLRTARNQFLIEPEEQERFNSATLALAGLSVGSSALHAIVLSGGPNRIRIADPDTLSAVNLNRLHGSICELGASKAVMAAERAYELNPFQRLDVWPEGVQEEFLHDFLSWEDQPVDLFVEEIDDLYLKIRSRIVARDMRIPVVMATDNGDNAIIDVERFDLEPERPLFHGAISEPDLQAVPRDPSPMDRVRIAATIVGLGITPRTQRSLQLVGSRLPSWPQLGNAATLSGAAVSYVARRLLCGLPMPSGRYAVSLDAALDPTFGDLAEVEERASTTSDFADALSVLFGVNLR